MAETAEEKAFREVLEGLDLGEPKGDSPSQQRRGGRTGTAVVPPVVPAITASTGMLEQSFQDEAAARTAFEDTQTIQDVLARLQSIATLDQENLRDAESDLNAALAVKRKGLITASPAEREQIRQIDPLLARAKRARKAAMQSSQALPFLQAAAKDPNFSQLSVTDVRAQLENELSNLDELETSIVADFEDRVRFLEEQDRGLAARRLRGQDPRREFPVRSPVGRDELMIRPDLSGTMVRKVDGFPPTIAGGMVTGTRRTGELGKLDRRRGEINSILAALESDPADMPQSPQAVPPMESPIELPGEPMESMRGEEMSDFGPRMTADEMLSASMQR